VTRAFDPVDVSSWPLVLNLQQVAAIYGRSQEAVRCALKPSATHRFRPAPYKTHPYQWRRADVERDVIGARLVSRTA
jgi:hypothetical protein